MKTVAFVIASIFLVSAAHAEMREFKKHDANSAEVTITTDEKDYTQAAVYLDGQENAKLITMLLDDPASELSKLKAKIELDFCSANSTPDDTWIPDCGEVEFSDIVKTSFGRGGWAEGQAGYSLFIGFRMQGTGHFLESLYLVTIVETALANQDEEYNYNGTITKTLNLGTIQKLPIQTSFVKK